MRRLGANETPDEYRKLAPHYDRLAEETRETSYRNHRHAVARTYQILAESMQLLERSRG